MGRTFFVVFCEVKRRDVGRGECGNFREARISLGFLWFFLMSARFVFAGRLVCRVKFFLLLWFFEALMWGWWEKNGGRNFLGRDWKKIFEARCLQVRKCVVCGFSRWSTAENAEKRGFLFIIYNIGAAQNDIFSTFCKKKCRIVF